jgi:hypothetical protein
MGPAGHRRKLAEAPIGLGSDTYLLLALEQAKKAGDEGVESLARSLLDRLC